MKREDFDRIKEEEKKHLQEIRALKRQLKDAERMQRIGGVLHDMQAAGDLEGFDRSLEEVQRAAAEQEARLELAVDSDPSIEDIERVEEDEETLKLARASEFVRQMKSSVGHETTGRKVGPEDKPDAREATEPEGDPPEERPDLDKTIGRMTPREKRT